MRFFKSCFMVSVSSVLIFAAPRSCEFPDDLLSVLRSIRPENPINVLLGDTCGGRIQEALSSRSHSFSSGLLVTVPEAPEIGPDRKSTRLNSSHLGISYAV